MTESHPDRHRWLAAARSAAATAADFIAHEAQTHRAITWEAKSVTDFVSHVDRGAEERIRERLLAGIPDLRIVGEELSHDGNPEEGLVAIVDPLDGTTNFLHGFPSYGVSICIALDGVPQAAVMHDVARGGVWPATAGAGAYVDGERGRVAAGAEPAR
ncbi:MAG: inositol monophosphatase family protein, partial [Gemmatimonadaceae bacterium]